MAIEYRQPAADDVSELGRICHDAFQDIAERHGFEKDFPNVQFAQTVIGMLTSSERAYGVAAFKDGAPAGSNFLSAPDEVGGVGPITVDPPVQGDGIGRSLMQGVLDYARKEGIDRVRLLQDSYNMTSLAIYASLGFDTKFPAAVMEVPPADHEDESVRPMAAVDLDAVSELSRAVYKVNRREEVASFLGGPFSVVVRERNGQIVGYLALGMMGHCVAETQEDAVVLAQQAARGVPPDFSRIFCPITNGSLYRRFLAAGFRNRKVMNMMAIGPYEEPDGVWTPSVLY